MAKNINYGEMWLARLYVDADQIFKIKFSQIITITNNAGSELIIEMRAADEKDRITK